MSIAFLALMTDSSREALYGEQIIKNPGKPLAKNAGRVAQLKETMAIHDKVGDYYFKSPRNLKVASDGSFFVEDEKQLLKFSPTGEFKRNYFKYGQGPFEISNVDNYIVFRNQLIIHTSGLLKMVTFDRINGSKLDEFRYQSQGAVRFIHFADGNYYFYRVESKKDTKGKIEIFDIDVNLIRIPAGGKTLDKIFSFPVRYLVLQSGDHSFATSRSRFLTCPISDDLMIVSHTPEYGMKIYSFKSNTIQKRITRDYKRTKTTEETKKFAPGGNLGDISIDDTNWYKVPVADFLLDIQQIFLFKNKIWVVTSTVTSGNQVLVDVYDLEFKYLDNFFLQAPSLSDAYQSNKWILGTDGESVFLSEEDDDGQRYIKKCAILQ